MGNVTSMQRDHAFPRCDSGKRTRGGLTSLHKKAGGYPHPANFDCVRVITAPPRPQCSPGYELQYVGGSQCCVKLIEEPVLRTCDSGTLRDKECSEYKEIDPSLECPPDFTLSNRLRKCRREIEMIPMEGCPDGYMMDSASRCVKLQRAEPLKTCPLGTVPVAGQCIRSRVVPPRISCPPLYKRDGDECLKAHIIESEEHCEGDHAMMNGECVLEKILDASIRCDEGYKYDRENGDCYKVLRKPVSKYCEDGVYNDVTEECEIMEAILPGMTCPSGYEVNDNDDCVKVDVQPVKKECSPGFELRGDDCVFNEAVSPTVACPSGYMMVEDACIRPSYKPKWTKCQNGFELEGDRCVAVEEIAPDFRCPRGFDLEGDICVKEVISPASEDCESPNAKVVRGVCVEETSKDPVNTCQAPYVYNIKTMLCEDEEVVAPELECPPGSVYQGGCVTEHVIKPVARCPEYHHYDQYYLNCKQTKRYLPVLPHQKGQSLLHHVPVHSVTSSSTFSQWTPSVSHDFFLNQH